ncbi:secretagogin [Brienomyrus brachyistius]|uniref:secretagogin n=1 Tax=Brienomyrus brachyistius TaxID=42636 RepID=UPI0020B36A9B|nr:secretagogin [Brienomyrus brachyistius]
MTPHPGGGVTAACQKPKKYIIIVEDNIAGSAAAFFARIMDIAFDNLDAGDFLHIWQHFDADDNGYIEGKELDDFFRHMMVKLRPGEEITEDKVQQLKRRFMSAYDLTADGRLQIHELANMILPEDENFLLLFWRETPLDNSVEFMKIWRKYDMDRSGFISAVELKSFLKDLIVQHKKVVSPSKLDKYTEAMMNIFDRNKDGQLDLNDLARILALQENFLLQFKMDASSQEERKRDFEKIFAHYDVSKTGALEGPEVDGFVKDMMELVKPSIGATDLDKFRQVLLSHCDMNRDGKIQKSELALCLGIKVKP